MRAQPTYQWILSTIIWIKIFYWLVYMFHCAMAITSIDYKIHNIVFTQFGEICLDIDVNTSNTMPCPSLFDFLIFDQTRWMIYNINPPKRYLSLSLSVYQITFNGNSLSSTHTTINSHWCLNDIKSMQPLISFHSYTWFVDFYRNIPPNMLEISQINSGAQEPNLWIC